MRSQHLVQDCNDQDCPIDCNYTEWTAWSACEPACSGITNRWDMVGPTEGLWNFNGPMWLLVASSGQESNYHPGAAAWWRGKPFSFISFIYIDYIYIYPFISFYSFLFCFATWPPWPSGPCDSKLRSD